MKKIEKNVNGMMCGGCEKRLTRALLAVDGMIKAEADFRSGRVWIELDDKVDEKTIKEVIEDLGFELVD